MARNSIPAEWSSLSWGNFRPHPISTKAHPICSVSIVRINPSSSAFTMHSNSGFISFDRHFSKSPPWQETISLNFACAAPFSMRDFNKLTAEFVSSVNPACTARRDPNSNNTAIVSLGPSPFKQFMDSMISQRSPANWPSGCSILVNTISVLTLNACPIFCIHRPSSWPWFTVFMKAPLPTFISRISPWMPSAIFLLMIELQIKGIEGTVAVLSLRV